LRPRPHAHVRHRQLAAPRLAGPPAPPPRHRARAAGAGQRGLGPGSQVTPRCRATARIRCHGREHLNYVNICGAPFTIVLRAVRVYKSCESTGIR
jgi:hypothetical protein